MLQEYILDTNILIYLFEGKTKMIKTLHGLNREYFFTSVISHFEFLVGAKNSQEVQKIKSRLSEMVQLDIRLEIVQKAVSLQKTNKKKLKFKDLLIAATALVEGLTLVTADKDFKSISGLKLKLLLL